MNQRILCISMLSALFAYLAFQIQLVPSHAAFATLLSFQLEASPPFASQTKNHGRAVDLGSSWVGGHSKELVSNVLN